MTRTALPVLAIAALLVVPAAAGAGTVTRDAAAITYQADASTGDSEEVGVSVDSGRAVLRSERGFSSVPGTCNENDTFVDCPLSTGWVIRLLGFDDSVSLDNGTTGTMTLEVFGGAGGDGLGGTVNADRLHGEDGDDTMFAGAGNDLLEGGAGADGLNDEAGDDTVTGGAGDDRFNAGGGRDSYSGGDGGDSIEYDDRTAAVTITLDDQADDGEAGEGDNVGADIEDAAGGSGADRIVGTAAGNRLSGGAGNDSISAGGEEDNVDGGEGDDAIDARDGGYDTIDCGPGNDSVTADQVDGLSNCESVSVPDADADGFMSDDCNNTDPAVHPGAFEIIGDGIDQDCDGIDAPRPRLVHPVAFDYAPPRRGRVRVRVLTISEMRAGDRVAITCKGRGCAFKKKTRTGRQGRAKLKLAPLFKKRGLRRGAVIEIRITRPQWVGKYVRFKVTKRLKVKLVRSACLQPGASKPSRCA